MGYTTYFSGSFEFDKELDDETYDFLLKLANTRRVKRDTEILKELRFDGNYGEEGEFFVDGSGFRGQGDDRSIINSNQPPASQPGLWLQWVPTEDKKHLVWDEGEKFYNYTEWLIYLIEKILEPKGYVLNGEVSYEGEYRADFGVIKVDNNKVECIEGEAWG